MSTSVTCKFRCVSKKVEVGCEGEYVRFEAVTTGPGNESWSKWTPSGRMEMMVTNPVALAALELGKDYLFTISEYAEDWVTVP